MHERFGDLLLCPVCSKTNLNENGHALKCSHGHSFDITSEGYVNLLRACRSVQRGDTKVMLRARRLFLERGYYDSLSNTINRLVVDHLNKFPETGRRVKILDIGSGEGYHINRLMQLLGDLRNVINSSYLGLDVSKEAARMAARRYPEIGFIVSDTHNKLPFEDQSIDILINIFAPRNPAEFHRILAQDGLMIIAIPGSLHLSELQSEFGQPNVERGKRDNLVKKLSEWFQTTNEQHIEFSSLLMEGDLINLLNMMPQNLWHRKGAPLTPHNSATDIQITADFDVLSFERKHDW